MNRKTEEYATIHRFNDVVAIHTDSIPTVYLTQAMAYQVAAALFRTATDISECKYTESTLETIRIK